MTTTSRKAMPLSRATEAKRVTLLNHPTLLNMLLRHNNMLRPPCLRLPRMPNLKLKDSAILRRMADSTPYRTGTRRRALDSVQKNGSTIRFSLSRECLLLPRLFYGI